MHDRIFSCRYGESWRNDFIPTIRRDGLGEPGLESLFNRFYKYQGQFAPNRVWDVWEIFLVGLRQHDAAQPHAMRSEEFFFNAPDRQHQPA
jgi:hypothetical protein